MQHGRRRYWTSWGGSGTSKALAATTQVHPGGSDSDARGAVFLLEGVAVEFPEVRALGSRPSTYYFSSCNVVVDAKG